MSIDKKQFSNYIKQFNFRELFNDMGWNNDKTTQPIVVDNETYTLQAVAEKSGFKILLCNPLSNGLIPDYNTRKKIESKVTKLFQEHLIIFFDSKKTEQIWQLVVRQSGKPTKVTETRWHINQDPELLYQRAAGIFFELDEEEHITIIDVTKRIADNFHQNNEKVTKQFYDKFKKEHGAFLQFIKGISDRTNQEWYASLMLNRLMFCYFIQKKGFLDNNKNYLRDKLVACTLRQAQGNKSQKFYSFYRDFLLVLFHKGLNEPPENRRRLSEAKIEIGKIPYLNGGLFDEHELEKNNANIDIDDKAFERLFDFFDQYEWHLDTRHTASGKDINPDVIGYIFEKYINDRANMGAYYTKEDITDYISKNCILPYLFDETKRHYPKAFNADAELWQMVKQSGDLYIYDAVKKGVSEPLPKEIEQGIKDVSKRSEWNKPATINYALPTEIWREVVDRRNRYTEVKRKIDKGEIQHINDFITYNLNIRQFAQDVVENTNDPELLKHFYKALNSGTIIDPTCGSGAFLFAAMNILEPLYEACLQRMEIFIEEAKDEKNYQHLSPDLQQSWKSINHAQSWFRQCLAQVKSPEHPNLQYFIYKSIILRNLYGVDIMKEAVEIAKLRLFLKLVATVEADYRKPNLGLEPLPDIDFNIRAGNTLVGFATEAELNKAFEGELDFDNSKGKLEEKCEVVANAFKRYKEIQLTYGDDFKEFKTAKAELNKRLKELNHELNQLLHKQASGLKYDQWLKTHQPFHWFAEFYEIVKENGGFDVIIGNPPYIAMQKIEYNPKIADYKCSDIFGYVIKRCFQILKPNSRYGFIVMHNLAFSRNFSDVRKVIKNNTNRGWFSFFARIPAGLFSGDVRVRNCIFLLEKTVNKKEKTFYTTRIHRWFSDARETLMQKLNYTHFVFFDVIPMFNSPILANFFEESKGIALSRFLVGNSKHKLYFKQSAYNWVSVSKEPAPCFDRNGKKILQSQVSDISFSERSSFDYSMLFLNGKTFFSQWLTYGDEFHLTKDDLATVKVPYDLISDEDKNVLKKLEHLFSNSIEETIQYKLNAGKNVGTFNTSKLWHITDQSDRIFLKYLCDNPDEVFNAIETHIYQTVITVNDNEEEE